MRMKVCKRIGALILALALILSGVPQMAIEALAEDATTVTNEFTVTGLNANTQVYNGGNHWRIALAYEGTFDLGGTWGKDAYHAWLDYSIDDVKAYGNIQCYQSSTSTENSYFTLQFSKDVIPTDGTANCKLTLKSGTWKNWDTSKSGTVYYNTMTEDVDIYFNEYGVSVGSPIQAPTETGVYIEEVATGGSYNFRNYVQFLLSKDLGYDEGTVLTTPEGFVNGAYYYTNSNAGIWVGENWYHGSSAAADTSIHFMKPATDRWKEGAWRLHPQWYKNNGAIEDGLRMTIQGLFYAGDRFVELDQSVMQWCVTEVGVTESNTGYWILLPRLLELAEGTTVDDGQWKIHMTHAGQLVGETDETFIGKAMVGEEEIEVQIYVDGDDIVITPPVDKVPADGTTVTMTLKAGDITGSAGSKSMIVNDVTFYINQHGLSLDAPIPETEEEYITKIHDIPATNSSSVYFEMSAVDAFGETITAGDGTNNIKPHAMSGVMDGAYYHESGVWIGDTRYAVDSGESPRLVKSDAIRDGNQKDYYIPFWSVSSKIVDGVKVRVKGLFGADGKFANIAESVMQYNATEDDWILLPRLLDIAKGAEKVDNQWKIYMNYVGTLAGQEGEIFTATAYKGDTPYNVQVSVEGNYLVLIPDAAALPTDGTEATIILKAGDITGAKGSTSYIVNDVTLCANKYGVSLDELIPSYTIVENKLDPMTTYTDETWDIYMKQSGSFLGEEGEVFKWPATIAGEDGTVDVYAKNVNGIIYFNPVIPDSDALKPANGKVAVVLKATTPNTVTGSAGTTNELKEDVTLYFDKNGLSVDDSTLEDVQMPTESMKLSFGPAGNNIDGIYFDCSLAGNVKADSSWYIRPTVVGGYKDGVCYRGDGGVYITDPDGNTTKFSPNSSVTKIPSLIKLSYSTGPAYYIGINNSHKVEAGTKVTIKGVYEWDGTYDSISETVVEWDGAQWINITLADDTDVELSFNPSWSNGDTGTDRRIFLFATDGVDTDKTNNPYNTNYIAPMPGEDNGIFYNGVRTKKVQIYKDSGFEPYTWSVHRVLLENDGIQAQVGDEVVIKGRFIANGHIVEYKEVRFLYDGGKWEKATVPTRVNLIDADKEETSNSFGFTTNIEDGLTPNAEIIKTFSKGGIYVNDKYNAGAYLYKLDGYYKVDLSGCGHTFVAGDTVTIDGTIEDEGIIVEYMHTVFTYQGDGKWALTKSGIPEYPIKFVLDTQKSYRDTESGDLTLLFTATDGLRGDPGKQADATYSGLVALVNGQPVAMPTFFKNSKSYYEVTIPTGGLPSTGDTYEIVIKRGILKGGWEAESGRYVQDDLHLYIKGEKINDKGTPKEHTASIIACSGNVEFTAGWNGVKNTHTPAVNLHLLIDGTDEMVVTTKKGSIYCAEDKPNSGVFINGVKQPNVGIRKYEQDSKSYYFLTFEQSLYNLTTDDVVVVNGTFSMANYYVTFDSVAVKWYDTDNDNDEDDDHGFTHIEDVTDITLVEETVDASDDAFLIETTGTTVDGSEVKADTVLYNEGTYDIVYNIGKAKLNKQLTIEYKFTSVANNGAGKADPVVEGDPNSGKLPEMVAGNANAAGQYITKVQATTHGTTVISMDSEYGENAYETSADFNAYGLDYVVDIDMDTDRDFKVLQLADTQTISSDDRQPPGAEQIAQTVAEKQFENLQYYIDKVVAKSKPDVILIAGDIIYSEYDDNGSMWIDLIEYMDSLQIPWAPVFGNHDPESKMGLDWQCAQMMNSTYCLFNRRHEGVGGNGNYSIGLARNGKLEKAIYMLDSNGCGNVARSGNTWDTWGYDGDGNMTQVRSASGFYQTQIDWYKKTAMRVNTVAGEVIPSIQCYHIGAEEVLLATRAAGYQYGDEKAGNTYAMEGDPNAETYLANGNVNSIVRPQTGDSGYKMGSFEGEHEAKGMLEIMNKVGTTGVFLGHNHKINTSMTYGGVRWTYGLKTGFYADDTVKKGGTLITFDDTNEYGFTLQQIQVDLEYSEPSLDADRVAENTAKVIYLNGNATRDAMSVQTEALVVSKDPESGIFVNAVKSDATVEKYAEDKYKVTLPTDAKVGDIVSIYGIFDNSADTHGVYFRKTLVLKYDGSQWSRISTTWTEKTTVPLETVVVDYSKVASYKLDAGILPTRIDAEGVKTDTVMNSITTYGESNVKYILDNVVYDRKYVLYNPGDVHVDEDLNVLDLVAMKKAENGEEAESLTESYAAQLGSDGLRKRLVAAETEKFIITGINELNYYLSGTAWRIYLDYKGYDGAPCNFNLGGLVGATGHEYISRLNHSVNGGVDNTDSFQTMFYQGKNNTVILQIPAAVVPSDGTANHKLTIRAQRKSSSNNNGVQYTYELMEDFTLYFNGTNITMLP